MTHAQIVRALITLVVIVTTVPLVWWLAGKGSRSYREQ